MIFRKSMFLVGALALGLAVPTAHATPKRLLPSEKGVPVQFKGYRPGSPVKINYADWDTILHAIVMETGKSGREAALPPRHSVGTRVQYGNQSSRRLEGNRVNFGEFNKPVIRMIHAIRLDLEKVPSGAPLRLWSRNEQLAYWLNLYNITVVDEIAHRYPIRSLKKLYYGTSRTPSLWDQKILKVAGVPLSLHDIEHKILIPKFRNPLVMFGLFHGFVGSSNIRAKAYTADNVYDLLKENAQEFIQSNRGMEIRGDTLKVAVLFKAYPDLFPDFNKDMKQLLAYYCAPENRGRVLAAHSVRASTRDFYIADVYGGVKYASDASVGNVAALMSAFVAPKSGSTQPMVAGDIGTDLATQNGTFGYSMQGSRLPIQAREYLLKIRKKNKERKGTVDIQEVGSGDRVQKTDEGSDGS
ncbi:DUF547 domain-containing protein [Kordiimonas marina]|uniref:DUF547 domain-containing protein n=1 Tax=Kordiimonas marina TaxID=2872312 RepID=UPI001FF4F83E|nr:DUF547 domain-containing protein [Kordiimonas marina]MCJ9429419.1 DUF547 domain-containing protein [Kordiimonas marina]